MNEQTLKYVSDIVKNILEDKDKTNTQLKAFEMLKIANSLKTNSLEKNEVIYFLQALTVSLEKNDSTSINKIITDTLLAKRKEL